MCVCVGRKFFTTKIKLREKKRGEQQQLTRGGVNQTADCRLQTAHKTQNTKHLTTKQKKNYTKHSTAKQS